MINIILPSRYKLDRKALKQTAESYLDSNRYSGNYTLNIVFVGRNKMRQIARDYKHEDIALPVLAFPYKGEKTGDDNLLGEIFICYPQSVLLAAEKNKTLEKILDWLVTHAIDNFLK